MEERLQSEDAWRSAASLGVLIFATSVVVIATSWRQLPAGMRPVFLGAGAASLAALGFLLLVRHRVYPRGFAALALGIGLPFLFVYPYALLQWNQVGRPFEVFWSLKLGLVAAPLVTPRSFKQGLALTLCVMLEAPLFVLLAHRFAIPLTQFPVLEPMPTIAFGIAAVAVLVMAQRRRTLVRSYLQTKAETETLRQLSGSLGEIGRQLDSVLAGIDRAVGAPSLKSRPLRSATSRLACVRDRIADLGAGASEAPDAPVENEQAERELQARDAHTGGIVLACTLAVLSILVTISLIRARIPHLAVYWAVGGFAVAVALAAMLVWTRDRPSVQMVTWTFVVTFVILLVGVVLATAFFRNRAPPHPYEPFVGPKLMMVVLPLFLPYRVKLVVLLEAILLGQVIVLFYGFDLSAKRAYMPLVEPWSALLFAGCGVLIMLQREQRHAASLRLLRAQRELAAMTRRAGLCLALRDQINSPLQVLHLSLASLERRHLGDPVARHEVRRQLAALSSSLPDVDDLVQRGLGALDIDAAAELRRRA
jgi:hypothetical protein